MLKRLRAGKALNGDVSDDDEVDEEIEAGSTKSGVETTDGTGAVVQSASSSSSSSANHADEWDVDSNHYVSSSFQSASEFRSDPRVLHNRMAQHQNRSGGSASGDDKDFEDEGADHVSEDLERGQKRSAAQTYELITPPGPPRKPVSSDELGFDPRVGVAVDVLTKSEETGQRIWKTAKIITIGPCEVMVDFDPNDIPRLGSQWIPKDPKRLAKAGTRTAQRSFTYVG